jgi:putative SOS response-associated peptidase YedK
MPVVLDDSQFDEWMRGTPDQAAALMKPYAGAIEAWEGLSAGSASQFKTAGGIAVAQPSIWLVRHHQVRRVAAP